MPLKSPGSPVICQAEFPLYIFGSALWRAVLAGRFERQFCALRAPVLGVRVEGGKERPVEEAGLAGALEEVLPAQGQPPLGPANAEERVTVVVGELLARLNAPRGAHHAPPSNRHPAKVRPARVVRQADARVDGAPDRHHLPAS